jgi:uncharacterized membrane protein
VVGVVVNESYDDLPQASYLDDDDQFQQWYRGKTLSQLTAMDPETLGIEGVSGATLTSMAVARGIPLAAQAALDSPQRSAKNVKRNWVSYWPDLVTAIFVLIGFVFSTTNLPRRKKLRITYQFGTIIILGFINGHLISQALITGWATSSIPWSVAPGLVLLVIAAYLVPVFSKHQPYCHHICPFGAIQQLTKSRLPWKVHLSKNVRHVLSLIQPLLLLLVVVVTVADLNFNLASIEPFDGFAFRIAGWATISVFVIGIMASLFVPKAYCKFGCPTGAAISFLRFRADSHHVGFRDWCAVLLLATAVLLWLAK